MIVSVRVASLRMEVGRAAPGSQVLPDFEVISCPWRAASVDQGSFLGPLLGKRPMHFSVWISFEQRFCCFERFCCFPEILLFRDSNRNYESLCLFLKRGLDRLPWSAETALRGQLIASRSGRTWLPGAALLTPILKGATLTQSHCTRDLQYPKQSDRFTKKKGGKNSQKKPLFSCAFSIRFKWERMRRPGDWRWQLEGRWPEHSHTHLSVSSLAVTQTFLSSTGVLCVRKAWQLVKWPATLNVTMQELFDGFSLYE